MKVNNMDKRLMTDLEKKALLVEMLKKLDVFFAENNITYYLAYGTLLGAVRHKGFIPWDDDVDLLVPRADVVKLIHLCENKKEELAALNLEIIEYGANKKDYYKRFKFADTRTVMEEFGEERSAVFVDIFPLDSIPKTESLKKKRKKKNRILRLDNLCSLCNAGVAQGTGLKKKVYALILLGYKIFGGVERARKCLERKLLKQTAWDTKGIMCATESGEGDRDFFDGAMWEGTIKLPFEGVLCNAPEKYHEILTVLYGDYMQLPPEEDRKAHEYYEMYWRE